MGLTPNHGETASQPPSHHVSLCKLFSCVTAATVLEDCGAERGDNTSDEMGTTLLTQNPSVSRQRSTLAGKSFEKPCRCTCRANFRVTDFSFFTAEGAASFAPGALAQLSAASQKLPCASAVTVTEVPSDAPFEEMRGNGERVSSVSDNAA
ncbi:hypothetical protein SKAU_G00074510 [Synaphobranchus kaupii]|uniref:Uncharacterized protein n=1 Tax=Synaphobranchus kaupii TaxID=118154 RepID=A0A9Q1G7W4_SYNKA|nr:hypothetical protein SKAU_G00074510 [Synaphobranchus kaupii]